MKACLLIVCIGLAHCIYCQLPATIYPSLSVHASSRGMAMGDQGIADATGTQTLLYNPAIMAFGQYNHELSVGYMPWLSGIAPDMRLMNLSYLHPVSETSAMGLSLSYLDLGQIDLRDNNGATLASFRAKDYHLDLSYALQLAEQHSIAVTMKAIGQNQFGNTILNHYSVAASLHYYGWINLHSETRKLKIGASLSDIGAAKDLPSTLGIGIAYEQVNEAGDKWVLGVDATSPMQQLGKNMRLTTGIEYGFAERFFLRSGLSLESMNRKFFSIGTGYKGFISDQAWGVDLYYLLPIKDSGGVSAFQNQFGITLGIQIGNFQ